MNCGFALRENEAKEMNQKQIFYHRFQLHLTMYISWNLQLNTDHGWENCLRRFTNGIAVPVVAAAAASAALEISLYTLRECISASHETAAVE